MQCTYKRTIDIRVNTVAQRSKMCYIFWVCVCNLSHPACKLHPPYYTVVCGPSQSITLTRKRHDFRQIVNKHEMCVLIFSTALFEIFVILEEMNVMLFINVHRSSCKLSVILVRLQSNLNFLDRFSKNTEVSNFMKSLPMGA